MAGNSELIDTVIDPKVYDDYDKLIAKSNEAIEKFTELAKAATTAGNAIGNVKTLREYNQAATNAAKATAQMQQAQANAARSAILQQEAQQRLQKSIADTAKANQQLQKATIDKTKSEQAAEEQTRRLADAEEKRNQAAQRALSPYQQLSAELNKQRNAAKDLAITYGENSRQFKDAAAQVNILDQRLKGIDQTLGQSQRNVGNYAMGLGGIGKQISGFAASYLSFYGVIRLFSAALKSNEEIGDSLAIVRQKAGASIEEVNKLEAALKKIDTRTSLQELADIAAIGAKRGVNKDDLASFAENLDKVNLALSGTISGGAEGVAAALEKINVLFGVTKKYGVPEALAKTGAALVELGRHGLTTSDNIQEFAVRVSASANLAKLSIPQVLAYGSAFQEAGFDAERSGTAFNKFLALLATKKDKFFAVAALGDAKLTLQDFTNLINTDTDAALKKFFAGLSAGNPTQTDFRDRLKDLGLKAGDVTSAIIGLAQNQGKLVIAQKNATKAFDDGVAALDQALIKNDTLAASVDRLSKAFKNLYTNPGTSDFFKFLIDNLTKSINGIGQLGSTLQRLFTNSNGLGFLTNISAPLKTLDTIDQIKEQYKDVLEVKKKFDASPSNYSNFFQKSSFTELKELFPQYKKAADNAVTAYNSFITGIKNGTLRDDGSLKEYKKTAIELVDSFLYLQTAYKIARNQQPKGTRSVNNPPSKEKDTSKQDFNYDIKKAKDVDEAIQKDENSTYEQRLASAEKFKKDAFAIIYKAEIEKTITGQHGNSVRRDIEKQYALDIVNINKDAQKELKSLYNQQLKDAKETAQSIAKNSLDVADQFGNNQKKIVQDNADDALLALSDQYAKGLISTQQYQLQKSDIEKQSGIDADEAEISRLKIRIGIEHQLGLDDQKDKDDLAKAERKRDKDTADYAIAQAQRVADGRKGVAQAEKALGDELLVFGKAIVDAQFTNQLNAIQDQKDALNDRTKNEIDAENRSLDNTSTKADKIAIINAKAAAQQAQLDQKAREAKQKQAQADRIFTIASIVENTAIGVSKALAEYIYPYSAIVAALVGALGAAQIATVLATPIPKYQMGTDYAKGGRSLVGEVGKEYVIQPDGKEYFTPDKPTIMNIPRGSKVIPHNEVMNMFNNPSKALNSTQDDNSWRYIVNATNQSGKRIERALNGQRRPKTTMTGWTKDVAELQKFQNYRKSRFN